MKFNVTSPCSHCPFRKDVQGYLHPERAAQIAGQMEGDDTAWFACHETTTSKNRSTKHPEAAQCAGLMILQQKLGRPNVAMRIAYAMKILKPDRLNLAAPVFDTYEEFIRHHTEAHGGKRAVSNVRRGKGRDKSGRTR